MMNIFLKEKEIVQKQILALKANSRRLTVLRIISFMMGVLGLYFLVEINLGVSIAVLVFFFGWLFYFAVRHQRNSDKIEVLKVRESLCAKELKAGKGDYRDFETGVQYKPEGHSFAADLDLLGKGSLYQMFCRAASPRGKQLLAERLLHPFQSKTKIRNTQQAVDELKNKPEFILDFLTEVHRQCNATTEEDALTLWAAEQPNAFMKPIFKPLLIVIPLLSIALLILNIAGVISFMGLAMYLVFVPLTISGVLLRRINAIHSRLSKQAVRLKAYATMIERFEQENWASEEFLAMMQRMKHKKMLASEQMRALSGILDRFDYRLNMLMGFVLNALLLWDLQIVHQLEVWKKQSGHKLHDWLEVMHEMEMLISQGLFHYHHPEFVIPTMTDKHVLVAEKAGHPFLSADKRIGNDITFADWSKFKIITGGNMAGKSTYLRTIGINLVLAMTGNAVCAQKFVFHPVTLITSIRTDDSLQENESYFYAELKKLQAIIRRLEKGEKLFLLLDEILKGTNSRDKLSGSTALMRQLMNFSCAGAVATHDVSLGKLEQEFPENIKNYCFEIEIKNNVLHFDYTIQPGVAENMNAVFLMKEMGITV